jgi:hypothetical protein
MTCTDLVTDWRILECKQHFIEKCLQHLEQSNFGAGKDEEMLLSLKNTYEQALEVAQDSSQDILDKQDAFDRKHLPALKAALSIFMGSLEDDWKKEMAEVRSAVASRTLSGVLFKVCVWFLEGENIAEEDLWYNNIQKLTFEEACNPPLYIYIYIYLYIHAYGHIWPYL